MNDTEDNENICLQNHLLEYSDFVCLFGTSTISEIAVGFSKSFVI